MENWPSELSSLKYAAENELLHGLWRNGRSFVQNWLKLSRPWNFLTNIINFKFLSLFIIRMTVFSLIYDVIWKEKSRRDLTISDKQSDVSQVLLVPWSEPTSDCYEERNQTLHLKFAGK